MKRRVAVHDQAARLSKRILTWCGRIASPSDLIHKRPNCKACRRALLAYRRRNKKILRSGRADTQKASER